MRTNLTSRRVGLAAIIIALVACAQPALLSAQDKPAAPDSGADWREAERGILADWVQLTFSDRFVKAGESYFSPDDSKIVFQAVEKPAEAQTPEHFYAMFVADVKRDGESNITGIDNIRRISPPGSANTCGWFHPTEPNVVIFASTITKPKEAAGPGFQRGSGMYKWMFPPQTRIVECDLTRADGTEASLKVIAGDGNAYCAEGSFSPDGRHLLYCSLQSGQGDLFIKDMKTGQTTRIVQAHGYDGGPFFSPDGKRISYRSDRNNDNLLQIFVADLAFDDQGEIVGIEREYQVTDESCVNWCPYWTKDGRRLVYASGALGEQNYEVFMVDADPGNLPGSDGTIRYGTAQRRITRFDRADVLPAFSHDGRWMMWTSRRAPGGEVHLWAARFVLDPDAPWKARNPEPQPQPAADNRITVQDPDTGRFFVYDMATHILSEYDQRTHQLTEVTDPGDVERARNLMQSSPRKQP